MLIASTNCKCILIHKQRNNKNMNSLKLKYLLVLRKEQKNSYKTSFEIKNFIFKTFLLYLSLFLCLVQKSESVYLCVWVYLSSVSI